MSSLTPCRFFAQGNCRFGNNCRFYHGQPTGGGGGTGYFGNRTLAPATFQPQHNQQQQQQGTLNLTSKSNQQNLDIIMETVKKDMQEWASSGIWPYSCYGPVGGKPCVPGFEDLSVDEYRYNYMINGGNLPPQIPLQFQQTFQLRQSYQQPTHENRITIERIATAPVPTSGAPQTQAASIFGGGGAQQQQPQAGSIFGGSSQQGGVGAGGSIFGGGATTQNVFGGGQQQQQPQGQAGSIFGGGSTFGQPQQQAGGGNIFGGAASTATPGTGLFQTGQQQQSIFGQPAAPAPSLFGQPQQQQQQPSIFGQAQQAQIQPQQQQQAGLFQQPQAGVPPGGMFQSQPQQPQQQGTAGGLFQVAQQQQAQQPQQPSIFGGAAGTSSIFGGGGQAPPPQYGAPAQAASIFGGPTGNSPLMQGGAAAVQPTAPVNTQAVLATAVQQKGVYTEESELTPEELEAFKADHFTLDNLPTRPPPQSLCL